MINKSYYKIKHYLLQFPLFENIRKFKRTHLNDQWILTDELLYKTESVMLQWPLGLKKPHIGLVKDFESKITIPLIAYWPRYKKFLDTNEIPYDYYSIDRSDWIKEAEKYDIIVWHNEGDPATLHTSLSKIYFLENYMGKICLPNQKDLWSYEEKVHQYYLFSHYNIPAIETFITNRKDEALKYIEKAAFPLVSKLSTGSGSLGVELLKTKRQAVRFINKVFSYGRKTYWTYVRQKDYIYFQKYLADSLYDLRVICVGEKYFGYFRMKPEDDFRASGAGLIVKQSIPESALLLAKSVKEKLNSQIIAVDMLKASNDNNYLVNEISISVQVDSPDELMVDGKSGYYIYDGNSFHFKSGRYWLPELALFEVLTQWIKENNKPEDIYNNQEYTAC
jgi:glutathione synthase/RimK-type ligase-like ATP-grasp enzyme